MPYNPLNDPGLKLYCNLNSGFYQDLAGTTLAVTAGQRVQRWSDLSGNGNHLLACSGTGQTLGVDSGGRKSVLLDGASSLYLPTSTATDAIFQTSGYSMYALFRQDATDLAAGKSAWLLSKNANSSEGDQPISAMTQGGNQVGRYSPYQQGQIFRPLDSGRYYGYGMIRETADSSRSGEAYYLNGVQATKGYFFGDPATCAGFDFVVGDSHNVVRYPGSTGQAFKGQFLGWLIWNYPIPPNAMFDVHRLMISLNVLPDVLASQPYALVVNSNSETTYFTDPTNFGLIARTAIALGLDLDAVAMLGQAGKSQQSINSWFPNFTVPPINSFKSQNKRVVYLNFEGINASWDQPSYDANYTLAAAAGVSYCSVTLFAVDSPISAPEAAFNAHVRSHSTANGYPIADWGNDPWLRTKNNANFGDGLHLNGTGVGLAVPRLTAAIQSAAYPPLTPPNAGDLRAGVVCGSVTGSLAVPALAQTLAGVPCDGDQGTYVTTPANKVAAGTAFGPSAALTGTLVPSAGPTLVQILDGIETRFGPLRDAVHATAGGRIFNQDGSQTVTDRSGVPLFTMHPDGTITVLTGGGT